jgi:hypothetical protein
MDSGWFNPHMYRGTPPTKDQLGHLFTPEDQDAAQEHVGFHRHQAAFLAPGEAPREDDGRMMGE